MSIFDDFDASFGHGTYSGMPDGIGGTDIFHDGIAVDHLNTDGVFDSHGFELSLPNAEGGHDVLDLDTGSIVSHSEPNEAGGMNIFDGDMHLDRFTTPNVEGGEDFYDSNMHLEGRTMPNETGSEDLYSFGDQHSDAVGLISSDSSDTFDHHANFDDHDTGDHHIGFDDHDANHSHFDTEHGLVTADHSNLLAVQDDSSSYLDAMSEPGNFDDILSHDDPLLYSSDFHMPKLLFPMMILLNRKMQKEHTDS